MAHYAAIFDLLSILTESDRYNHADRVDLHDPCFWPCHISRQHCVVCKGMLEAMAELKRKTRRVMFSRLVVSRQTDLRLDRLLDQSQAQDMGQLDREAFLRRKHYIHAVDSSKENGT